MAKIELKKVGIRLGSGAQQFNLTDISLSIAHGEFVVFVGPSGSGKSTLLRAIAGLQEISAGEIWIGERRADTMSPSKRGIAMVFQNYALYPHMTVAENMGFALRLAGRARAEIAREVQSAAESLQIEHLLDRKPKALSGGQRQRVAIGRALVRDPDAFLLDEPLSNLDAGLRSHMRAELKSLHRRLGSTMVYVTHDQIEAMTLADRIVILSRSGLEQIGTPMELFRRPASRYVAEFVGTPKMNTWPVAYLGGQVELAPGYVTPAAGLRIEDGARIVAGIRPRHLYVAQSGPLSGRVVLVERLGDEALIHVAVESCKTTFVVASQGSPPAEGESVQLQLKAEHIHLFDEKGVSLRAT